MFIFVTRAVSFWLRSVLGFFGNRISARFQIVPRLIIATRPYELQRPYSTLFRALDRDAGLLESLRADRWRTARIFIAAQTTRRDYHVDRVGSVRLVRLQKSGRDVRHDSAAVCHDRGDQTIRRRWNKRRELETNA